MEVLKQNLTCPAFLPVWPDSLPEPLGYPEDYSTSGAGWHGADVIGIIGWTRTLVLL